MQNKCLLPHTKGLILAIFNFLNFIKRKVTPLACLSAFNFLIYAYLE